MRRSGKDDAGPATVWPWQALWGRIDERRARELREEFGRRRWLLSWRRASSGGWMARLSGPGQPATIERVGRTRVAAIRHAARSADQVAEGRALLAKVDGSRG